MTISACVERFLTACFWNCGQVSSMASVRWINHSVWPVQYQQSVNDLLRVRRSVEECAGESVYSDNSEPMHKVSNYVLSIHMTAASRKSV